MAVEESSFHATVDQFPQLKERRIAALYSLPSGRQSSNGPDAAPTRALEESPDSGGLARRTLRPAADMSGTSSHPQGSSGAINHRAYRRAASIVRGGGKFRRARHRKRTTTPRAHHRRAWRGIPRLCLGSRLSSWRDVATITIRSNCSIFWVLLVEQLELVLSQVGHGLAVRVGNTTRT